MHIDPRVAAFVFGAILLSACKHETTEPVSEPVGREALPDTPTPSVTLPSSGPSENAQLVALLTCGLVEDPSACATDSDCRITNLDASSKGCCTCMPTSYAIAQRGLEDWTLAEAGGRSCSELPGLAQVDGRWARVACEQAECAPCAGGHPSSEVGGVCRAGHCELP